MLITDTNIQDARDLTFAQITSSAAPMQLKMPSIAMADEDKAKLFAETLSKRVILLVDDAGKLRVAIK